jgi:hypothetical protein
MSRVKQPWEMLINDFIEKLPFPQITANKLLPTPQSNAPKYYLQSAEKKNEIVAPLYQSQDD